MLTLAAQLTGSTPQEIAQALHDLAQPMQHGQVPEALLIASDQPTDELVLSIRQHMTPPAHGHHLILLLSGEQPSALADGLNFLADELHSGETDMTGRQGPDWAAHLCEYEG